MAECILNNEKASPELKKSIEENKDDLMKAIYPLDHRIEGTDHEIIRDCKTKAFDLRRDEFRREHHFPHHHEHHHEHRNDL